MKTGLFFGSFNPIHIGHLAIANYMLEFTDLDELCMVISPQNPFKTQANLLNEYDRMKMVEIAIGNNSRFSVSDIEFHLPKPSYTIDTLTYLSERYPSKQFVLLIGTDNLEYFHKWKNYEEILKKYKLIVYPRPGSGLGKYANYKNIQLVNAPLIEISSSFIRESIKSGKNIQHFLPASVYDYIRNNHLYEK
ncbi:MAG: nicotinic acid mononucleotide adenylyltransferase [Bacteroidetes bacterium GWF2_33_16]|nr:MAG: nicotinic acid mononucleotide adenylyltransferase [Bacteroidetes bacterium GWE2_32_14]OFY06489.1 MAG: nicotinic acid mononucleotide adenylyltransferase [Bacteroidetes bacterium GWF2_33_16]